MLNHVGREGKRYTVQGRTPYFNGILYTYYLICNRFCEHKHKKANTRTWKLRSKNSSRQVRCLPCINTTVNYYIRFYYYKKFKSRSIFPRKAIHRFERTSLAIHTRTRIVWAKRLFRQQLCYIKILKPTSKEIWYSNTLKRS